MQNRICVYNEDCTSGADKIASETIDLMICDPPFGIGEADFSKHYFRDNSKVDAGYTEAPEDYYEFTRSWLAQAKRILKPNGCLYIVSGWTNLHHVLNAVMYHDFHQINHIIWKYNFGVYTSQKFVSSHYHILFLKKTPSANIKFNNNCRFSTMEKTPDGGSARYVDMEDVWNIKKEYRPQQEKNINKLPDELVEKMMLYSSDVGDNVCDFFLGNFTTANVGRSLGRNVFGFEVNPTVFDRNVKLLSEIEPGCRLKMLKAVVDDAPAKQGEPLTASEVEAIQLEFRELTKELSKKDAIQKLTEKFGRGRWSIERILKRSQ